MQKYQAAVGPQQTCLDHCEEHWCPHLAEEMVQLEEAQGKISGLEQLPYSYAVSREMLRFH